MEDGKPVATVEAGDSVIFFNFRPDRAREITRAFIEPDFDGLCAQEGLFARHLRVHDAVRRDLRRTCEVAFKPADADQHPGRIPGRQAGKTQLRIAETEKYAHVTFFFNGGVEAPERRRGPRAHPLAQGGDL